MATLQRPLPSRLYWVTRTVSVPHSNSLQPSSMPHPKAGFLLQCDMKCDIQWNAPWALRTIVERTWQLNGRYPECTSPPWKQELRSINQVSSTAEKERKESCQQGWRRSSRPSLGCKAQLLWMPTELWNQLQTHQPKTRQWSPKAASHSGLWVQMWVVGSMVWHDNRDSHAARARVCRGRRCPALQMASICSP